MTQTTYLRYPHLSGTTLTFVADDDVWITEIPGIGASARAWRVTADRVPVRRPRLSPDGARIAWTSWREGDPEAFVVPVDGGEATRLTYWGHYGTETLAWSSPDEVLVRGWAGHGHREYRFAHAIPVDGGVVRKLPYGSLTDVDISGPDGAVVLARGYSGRSFMWKRYRGGTAGKLWIDPAGTGEFHRFLEEIDGNLGDPIWFDDRVVFHSDHDGVAELYSALRDGTDLRRHTTDPDGFYLRHCATDGVRIVFQRAGRLWLMEDLEDDPRPLDIRLPGARTAFTRFPIEASRHLKAVAPDRTGRGSAVEVRGTVHWLTHKDGPARVLQGEDGVRGRLPVVLGETGQVAWITDAGNQYTIEIAAADGTGEHRRILSGEFGYVMELAASPDGKQLAVTTRDNKLHLVDVEAGTARVVVDGEWKFAGFPRWGVPFVGEPTFSPDSKWLAWSQKSEVSDVWQIRIADVGTLTAIDVTEPRFRDWNPVFTGDGKHLVFLSARTFDTYEEDMYFDFSFMPAIRPYLVPLTETEPSPFAPELGGRTLEEPKDSDKDEDVETPTTRIDTEGIAARAVPFPVASGSYRGLAAVKGGVVWLTQPITGALGDTLAGSDVEKPRASLVRYDFDKREQITLAEGLDFYAVSGDGKQVAVADRGELSVRSAVKADDEDKATAVDLERIRVTIEPAAERRQGFLEAWRFEVENYYQPGLPGLHWDGKRTKYEPLVAATATHDDFVDLLWELQGELGTSHAYVSPPGNGAEEARQQGQLGADLAPDESGVWRIMRILPGDSSVPEARSPLLAPGVAARVGDAIVAVDGRAVEAKAGPAALLAGKAGKPVELTLVRDSRDSRGSGGSASAAAAGSALSTSATPASAPEHAAEPRRVVVVPIADEIPLRYQAWVADRRAHVLARSGGRLGYIHLPDQAEPGWAEFHRDLRSQVAKDGLIVDTRGNRGGLTSGLVVEKLLRKPIGWWFARGEVPEPYPSAAPRGPLVSVCDEFAGSDGDIINQALKDHGVPVVGTRTWGGVVGIDDRFSLVDGTFVTQPRYAVVFESLSLGLENHGCDPTVEVAITPQDFAADRDPQLDKAIEIALDALAKEPPAAPPAIPGVYEP